MPGDSARERASDQSGNSGSIYLPCRRRIGDRTRGVRVDRRGGICTRPRAMPKQRAPVAGSDSIGKSTARPEDSGLRPAAGPPSPSPARARSTVRGQRRRRRRRMEMRDIDPPDLGARPRAILYAKRCGRVLQRGRAVALRACRGRACPDRRVTRCRRREELCVAAAPAPALLSAASRGSFEAGLW